MPTPTPTPDPSPTPSPSPNIPPTVSIAEPLNGSSFVVGSSVTISANASDSDGEVVKVDFYASGSLIGSVASPPYSFIWNNIDHGVYTLTARATDNAGASTTSNGVSVTIKKSPASVIKAKSLADTIAGSFDWTGSYAGAGDSGSSPTASAVASDLTTLSADIEQAYEDFKLEKDLFGAAGAIEPQLQAALYFTRADAALALKLGPAPSLKAHLERVIAHLSITEDLMLTGNISPATVDKANRANARINVSIGPISSGYGPVAGGIVAPASLGALFGDAVQSPLGSQPSFASLPAGQTLPVELSGVSVSIGGEAAPILYVSPARVTFLVPADLPSGDAEVIVVSQSGYVSKGSISIMPNVTRIMTSLDDETGPAMAINDARQMMEPLPVNTWLNFSPDKRTRLTFFATGVSGSAANTDTSNDVTVGGVVIPNLAESVVVEAHTQDGRVYRLPVEFAGPQGVVPGLDQINVVLVPELQDAGMVDLTLIVNGQRSNAPTIVVH
jgi:uncharacterized protein (TIGR03437 family)